MREHKGQHSGDRKDRASTTDARSTDVDVAKTFGNRAIQRLLDDGFSSDVGAAPPSRGAIPNRSLGRPLDADTRSRMESSFAADFSDVRVHTGAEAATAAQDIGASAYTIGSEIAFAAGEYAPHTAAGRTLLAHELTHVVQQRGLSSPSGASSVAHDPAAEAEADTVSGRIERSATIAPSEIRHRPARAQIARQPAKAQEFPGFSQQDFVTCGAASLVSAIMIWDRERKDPSSPNTLLLAACNAVLVYLDDNKSAVVKRLDAIKFQGATGHGQAFYDLVVQKIKDVRTAANVAGAQLNQSQYQDLSFALYLLYKDKNAGGLNRGTIQSVQSALGIGAVKTENASSFDAIMDKLVDLKAGQIAQINWYSRGPAQADGTATFTDHVFLVGRFQRGTWFVSDQGDSPPTEIEAPDLVTLKAAIAANTRAKNGGIHTGDMPSQTIGGMQVTPLNLDKGMMILGDRSGIQTKARDVVMTPGDFIAEVDASSVRDGDRIVAWDFVARAYSLADAQKQLAGAGTGSGGVIVENPQGLFHVFKTNLVADHNVMETAIDESDSAGGKVAPKPKRYYHAWLQLRSATRAGSFFQVY